MSQSAEQFRICGLAAMLLWLASGGCSPPPTGPGAPARSSAPVPVTTRQVRIEPVQRFVSVVGTLWGDEDASIAAKVPGRIARIHADVGDRAAPGEALAQLEVADYELAVRQKELSIRETLAKLDLSDLPPEDFDPAQVPTVRRARLQAENAEARYNRGRQLHEQDPPLISDQDFADLKTAWEVARSNYEVDLLASKALLAEVQTRQADLGLARQRLSDTTIRAPLPHGHAEPARAQPETTRPAVSLLERSYAVSARMASVGEYVREGTILFRVVDDDPVKLRAFVPERHAAEVRIGQKARLLVEAYSQEFEGVISRVNPQIDPGNRTFQVEILVANTDRRLKPGAFARAMIETDVDPRGMFVPADAVLSFAGVHKVYTVRDGKAAEIVIEPGQRRGDYIEVVKGLKGDEVVIVDGINKMANGVAVTISTEAASAE